MNKSSSHTLRRFLLVLEFALIALVIVVAAPTNVTGQQSGDDPSSGVECP